MELTTQQIYALFTIGTCIVALIGLTYCAGLKTGNASGFKYGRTTAGKHWRRVIAVMRTTHAETARQLDSREREIRTLRANIQAEADDHAKVERGLLQRLAAAAPLTDEDQATLEAIAAKLELAASTFAGLGSGDHARFARQLQQYAINMTQRLKAAQINAEPHPDTELVEFMDREATFHADFETIELRMMCVLPEGISHVRQALRQAMTQAAEIEQNHSATLQEAAV